MVLAKSRSIKKEDVFDGPRKRHKWVVKKEKNYQAYAVFALFPLLIIILTLSFYFLINVDLLSKRSPPSDIITKIHNGNEIKSIYDISE